MGGCRCSYQNCTVKTDKKTHFYHYPVFDKVRCHQWLSNARKLEYLNLKVSQLKNRVVCEHHFRNDMFMNELRVKLRCDAVPTEDGPYNNPSIDLGKPCYPPDELSIVGVEDIEAGVIKNSSDKKAVFSHKYGDFLTNLDINEITDTSNVYMVPNNTTTAGTNNTLKPASAELPIEFEVPIIPNQNVPMIVEPTYELQPVKNQCEPKVVKRVKTLKPVANEDREAIKLNIKMLNQLNDHTVAVNKPVYNYVLTQDTVKVSEPYKIPHDSTPVPKNAMPKSPKIKILSEKRIHDLNEVKTCVITNNIRLDDNNTINRSASVTQIINNENYNANKTKHNTLLKSDKDSKRSFTKKLRDIIKTSIDRMDDHIVLPSMPPETTEPVVPPMEEPVLPPMKDSGPSDTVMSHLSLDPNLPSLDKYTISYLESRLNRMENLLLNKINQNSTNIIELKSTINKQIDIGKRKDSEAEKEKNPEYHKKKLYQEISQFLPTDINSMIYEQLFLHKFEKKNIDSNFTPGNSKRRKTRRTRADNEF